jgi:Flp pilus assembly protein TadG
MMLRRRRRTGTTLVESAFIYPVLFLIVAAIVLLGTAVFRYQQVAHAAREAARYASVHGARYAADTKNPAATEASIYTNVVSPMVPWVQRSGLTVAWNTSNAQTQAIVVTDPVTGLKKPVAVSNTVSATVTYIWDTGWFGTIPLSSTSVAVMSY